jgi:hypothetical protein
MPSSPILVPGSHRSGTTWIGRVLAFSPNVGYVQEPFNVHDWPNWLSVPLPHVFTYICDENSHPYERSVGDALRFRYPVQNIASAQNLQHGADILAQYQRSLWYRLRQKRPLVKDPIAIMSAEWIARRFNAQAVVMIRHPAAFASSIKRLQCGDSTSGIGATSPCFYAISSVRTKSRSGSSPRDLTTSSTKRSSCGTSSTT